MDKFDKYILNKELDIEHRSIGSGTNMRPHSHNSYELCFFESGKRTVVIDDRIYSVDQNDVMLVKPNVIHGNVSGEQYSRTVIYFTEKFLEEYYTQEAITKLTKCFDEKILTLSNKQFAAVKNIFKELSETNINSDDSYTFAYITQLIIVLSRAEKLKTKRPVTNTLTEIMSYIRKNFTDLQGLDEIASDFNITKEYLCRLFKKNMHCTVTEYINTFKIQKACRMLADTDRSITDIGFECGFNSTMYFCRIFKKNIDMTPGEYRKIGQHSEKIKQKDNIVKEN